MFEIVKRNYNYCGHKSYDYAVIKNGITIKGGFENEWQARLWFLNDSGFSIVLLK